MANDINDLRAQLFETIKGVKDGSLDVAKAKVISDLSQVVINSAKVEVDFLRARGETANGTGFIPEALPAPGQPRLVKGQAQSGSK